MVDIARIQIEADSRSVRTAGKDLDTFDKSGQKASNMAAGLSTRLVALAGAYLSVSVAAQKINKAITDVREFETGMVGVAKTTGLAGQDLTNFGKNIESISRKIPVSTTELLSLAQAAGQMGVTGSANLEKFSITVAKLGRASDLSGEQAATALARILNVTGESISEIDILASVIVSLGNNVAATESEIARMTTEVARATSAFGVSSAEAAAMAAAMSSIGIRAELGGSSVGRAMQEITSRVQAGGKDLREFAEVLGLNGDTLAELFADDKTKAFEFFLQAVGRLGLDAGNALDKVGLGGQEIAKTIVPLSNNMDIFADTMALANAELENATALNNEAAAAMDTANSRMDVAANISASLGRALATDLAGGMDDVVASFNEFMGDADNFNDTVDKISTGIGLAGDAAKLAALIFGARMVSALGASSAKFIGSLAPVAKYNAALMITQKSSLAASVAQGAMAASTRAAKAAFALIGGPMGALVITGAALYAMWNRNNEAMGTFTAVIGRTREAIDQAKMSGGSLDVQIAAVERGIVDLSAELANTNFLFGENSRESRELQQELALQRGRLNTLSREQAAHNLLVAKGTEGSAAFVGPIRQVTEAVENNTGALGENSDALEENYSASVNVFKALAEEMHQLNMTARERAIYNNVIQAGIDASPEEIAAITAATNALFDQRDAIDDAKEATEWWTSAATNGARQRSEAERIAGEEMRESQARTHEFITGTLIDIYESGGSAFDKLADSFKAMIKRMVAEWAASKLMNLFGMDGGGSNPFAGISLGGGGGGGGGTGGGFDITKLLGGGGQSNPLGSLLDRYTGKIRQNTGYNDIVNGLGFGDKAVQGGADWSTGMPEATGGEFNADQLTAGLKQAGITMVASAGGGYLGNEAGESWTGKRANSNIAQTAGSVIGSIFGPWGTFAGSTIGGFVDSAFGSGSPSSNAGIYLDPNAGAGNDRFFDIERFASGFQAQGFARREDEGEARKIASIFGTADFAFTEAVKELGGMIDISGANMALKGYSIDGGEFGGGSFMGYSSERGEGVKSMSMDEQLSRYIEQLADNVHGIDEELLAALKAAGSAEQAFQLLSDAVDKAAVEAESAHEEAAKTATEETEKQVESLTSFERAQKRASESVMAAYASGLTELDAVDRAFKTFQLYAERGLTSSAIARFTGELQSDIDAVLNRGRALGNAGDAANDSSVAANDSSVTGSRRTKSDVISDILGLSTGTIDVGGSSLLRFSGSNLGFTESQLRGGDKATINDVARRLGIDGSHANGLPRVPFDGYRAELHRNEEVLTASDPRNRNNGGGSMADLRAELRAIAHQTKRTSDILLRVTRDGNALMTEAVA